ncbi:SecDF P1 head subdomain-containing protein [Pusillimonas sp.]|uniref:SecDF P1 head subdomain-containing protein n=1 Tax=Pusillimonas sp. TaxID=3040095 RepID=UPI0037C53E88
MRHSLHVLLSLCMVTILAACQPLGVNSQNTQAQNAIPLPQQQAQSAPSVLFLIAQNQPAQNLQKVDLSKTQSIYVLPNAVLTRNDLARVESAAIGQDKQAFVVFTFNQAGTQKLAALSEQNIGKSLALVINGTLVAVPKISGLLNDGVLGVQVANHDVAQSITRIVAGQPAKQ